MALPLAHHLSAPSRVHLGAAGKPVVLARLVGCLLSLRVRLCLAGLLQFDDVAGRLGIAKIGPRLHELRGASPVRRSGDRRVRPRLRLCAPRQPRRPRAGSSSRRRTNRENCDAEAVDGDVGQLHPPKQHHASPCWKEACPSRSPGKQNRLARLREGLSGSQPPADDSGTVCGDASLHALLRDCQSLALSRSISDQRGTEDFAGRTAVRIANSSAALPWPPQPARAEERRNFGIGHGRQMASLSFLALRQNVRGGRAKPQGFLRNAIP